MSQMFPRARVLLAASATVAVALVGVAPVAPSSADHRDGHGAVAAQARATKKGHGSAAATKDKKPKKDKKDKKDKKPKKDKPAKPKKTKKPEKPKHHGPRAHAHGTPATPATPATPGHGAGKGHGRGHGPGAGQAHGDPSGNNGTVKIARLGSLDTIPSNTPHPGCTFQVEWYGFDEGPDVVSTVAFAMQAPTRDVGLTVDGPSQVFVGGDPASGAGTSTGLDGRQAYTLSFDGAPHPKQGYHVRLTVKTPRSRGNDTLTKVFWVEPCAATTPSGSGSRNPARRPSTPAAAVPGTPVPVADGEAGVTAADAPDDDAPGQADTATDATADVPTAVDAGAGSDTSVVGTVTSPAGLLTIALGLLTAVAAFLLRRRSQA
jgi:hypothetical protein